MREDRMRLKKKRKEGKRIARNAMANETEYDTNPKL